jgi:hypothetical protein
MEVIMPGHAHIMTLHRAVEGVTKELGRRCEPSVGRRKRQGQRKMVDLSFHPYRYQASMERQVEALRSRPAGMDLGTWALLTGGRYERGKLTVMVLGEPVVIVSPGFEVVNGRTGEPAPINMQALLLYHLRATDGAPLTGRWISFRELPDGGFYHRAFQGYTGNRIAATMGNDLERLRIAAERLGGEEKGTGGRLCRIGERTDAAPTRGGQRYSLIPSTSLSRPSLAMAPTRRGQSVVRTETASGPMVSPSSDRTSGAARRRSRVASSLTCSR